MERSLIYIDGIENEQTKSLMFEAHQLVMNLVPQVVSVYKWKTAFFEYCNAPFCYLNIHKDHIYLSFLRMKDELISDALEIEHLKSVSKVYITDQRLLQNNELHELIIQAAMIQEKKHKRL